MCFTTSNYSLFGAVSINNLGAQFCSLHDRIALFIITISTDNIIRRSINKKYQERSAKNGALRSTRFNRIFLLKFLIQNNFKLPITKKKRDESENMQLLHLKLPKNCLITYQFIRYSFQNILKHISKKHFSKGDQHNHYLQILLINFVKDFVNNRQNSN